MSRERGVKCGILNFFVAEQSVCCGFMRRSLIRVNKSCKVIIYRSGFLAHKIAELDINSQQSQNAIGYKYVALDVDLET